MSDMFIPKKEKFVIIIQAIIYVLLIVLASYFTVYGNMFFRMVPMIYILGIFGVIAFNKPIVTIVLSCISTISFGFLIEQEINLSILFYAIYSVFMILCGEVTGHILNMFYENIKLRKFIKYYHRIIYFVVLLFVILIPVILNNIVNSNVFSYIIAKKDISKYINDNYAFTEYYMENISYNSGKYIFDSVIDGIGVKLEYNGKDDITDINMENRKKTLNRAANASMNILLSENELTYLNTECRYAYSKISTIPDIIRVTIRNAKSEKIDDVIKLMQVIKQWEHFDIIDRIDIMIDSSNVSITKDDLNNDKISKEYLLKGMKQEMLDSKEGI